MVAWPHVRHTVFGDSTAFSSAQLLHAAQLSCNTFYYMELSSAATLLCQSSFFFLQSMKEKADVESIQERNRVLLSNILPSHVIDHFLNPDVDPSVQLI